MNKITILAAFLLCTTLSAQKHYKVWVDTYDQGTVKGYVYSANKESFKVIHNDEFDTSNITSIDPKQIFKIKIRKKGRVGKSILIGGSAGVLTGVVGAYILVDDSSDFTKGDVAVVGGIMYGAIGAGIGAIVGIHKKKLKVNGQIEAYQRHLYLLRGYAIHTD